MSRRARATGIVAAILFGVLVGVGAISLVKPTPAHAQPTAPGTVVGTGELPREWWIPGTARAYTTTYTTTGPGNAPALSTGAVYLPEGMPPPGGWPVVSWAHGTVGIGDRCAPSRNPKTERDSNYLSHWLRQGYAVVASDYVGLGTPGVHPYLDGRIAAHSVIDMVRAARAQSPELSRKWVVIGQSQGGHAAMFTARLATGYAPELDYRGAVGTGVPTNLDLALPIAGPYIPELPLRESAAYIAYALTGLRAGHPDLNLDDYLSPRGRELLNRAETACSGEMEELFESVTIGELFSRPLLDPAVQKAIRDTLTVPVSGYDRPLFIGQGIDDRTLPYPLTLKFAADLALNGVNFTIRPYPHGHSETMADSLPDSTPFVRNLFAD